MDQASIQIADKLTTESLTYVKFMMFIVIAAVLSAVPAIITGWFSLKQAIINRKKAKEDTPVCGPTNCPYGHISTDVISVKDNVVELKTKADDMKEDNRYIIATVEDLHDWHKPKDGKFLWYRAEDIDGIIRKVSENVTIMEKQVEDLKQTVKELSNSIENIMRDQVSASKELRIELNAIQSIFQALRINK